MRIKNIGILSVLLVIQIPLVAQNKTDENGNRVGIWYSTVNDTVITQTITILESEQNKNGRIDTSIKNIRTIEGSYLNGKKNGKWISRYSGKHEVPNPGSGLMSIFNFENDSIIGDFSVFHSNGKIMYSGTCLRNETIVTVRYSPNPNSEFVSKTQVNIYELLNKWSNLKDIE